MSKRFAKLKSNVRHWWNTAKFPITAHAEIGGSQEWSGRHQQAASLALAVVTALVMLPNLSYPLIEPDETRYAQIALEINKSNDWITPRIDGKPYLDKPPLMYWLTAGSFAILGNNEFAARMPSVLSSMATVLVVYFMGARIIGRRAAWLASVSLLLCGGFAIAGRFLILDSLLTLFVTSSLLSGFIAVREPVQSRTNGQRWKWWMLSGIACALGVLTKGPIALILCAPPLAISGWLRKDQSRVRLLHWVAFVIPMILVCIPWYIAVWRSNPEFGEYFFLEHNLRRFTEGSNHQQPFWFYLPIVFAGMFPASLLLPSLAVFIYSGSIKKQRLRSKDLGFLACAATWIVLFFSIASCKLPTYILPAIPLLCLMLGAMLEHNVFNQNIQTRITTYLKPFPQRASLIVLGMTFLALAIQVYLFKRFDIPTLMAGFGCIVLSSITFWGWNREIAFSNRGWCFVAVVAVTGISFTTGRLIPSIAAYRSVNARLASLAAEHPDALIAFLGKRTHGLELSMNVDNARYFSVTDKSDFIDFVKRSPNTIVVARSEDLRQVSEGLVFTHKFASDSENKYLYRATMLVGSAADVDLGHAEDVESMDYRFGTDMTMAEGPWAAKCGYFHVSSHVGDEYLIRNPTFQRVNYVTESWVAALSYSPSRSVRLYGEFANAFRASGGAKRYQLQTGAEFTPKSNRSSAGAPFAAIHLNFREAVDYDVSTTIQAGWMYQGPISGRRLRFGLQYGQGPTSQYEFFTRREEYLAIGTWFDY